MSKEEIMEGLRVLLADNYAMYLKAQNYHWNVSGANFYTLHKLFEEHYNEFALAIDEIAERIRALGEKVPASFAIFDASKTLADGDENAASYKMVKDLAEDHANILELLHNLGAIANNTNDFATQDLITRRIAQHQKNLWILSSILESEFPYTGQ